MIRKLFPILSVLVLAAPSRANLARELGNAIADAVETAMPAVVSIRVEAVRYRPVHDVFRGRIIGIPHHLAGQGSGVIIDEGGHVLTSNHVIEGMDEIDVGLQDGRRFKAEVVGRDPYTDLAVLKLQDIGDTPLQPIEAGDSEAVRVGEFVVAIGSPFSLDSSVTLGIVSHKGRTLDLLPMENFIQTDAAINMGNSGGPLVDAEGRMVGINMAIHRAGPHSDGNVGIAFTVPSNLAMTVARQLIEHGRPIRPWLGIEPQQMSPALARRYFPDGGGVVVAAVFRGTPAARAGVQPGDVIRAVNGARVDSIRALQRAVFNAEMGSTLQVRVWRQGEERDVEVRVEAMPALES